MEHAALGREGIDFANLVRGLKTARAMENGSTGV